MKARIVRIDMQIPEDILLGRFSFLTHNMLMDGKNAQNGTNAMVFWEETANFMLTFVGENWYNNTCVRESAWF